MFDFSDPDTSTSLQELDRLARAGASVVIWIGAGASRWAGYPSWGDVARAVHRAFIKRVPAYPRDRALELLKATKWPALFDLCASADRSRYLEYLLESLKGSAPVAPYSRFLKALQQLAPIYIVTTNVDEQLEHALQPAPQVFQNTDLERVAKSIQSRTAFIAKLHGSISQANALVFSGSDYARLIADPTYLSALRNLFYNTTVVFVGYGLADDYVLGLLSEVDAGKTLFGDGPHFLVTSGNQALPRSVLRIRYRSQETPDHRSAIEVLEDISRAQQPISISEISAAAPTSLPPKSTHLLADVFVPGAWETSVTLRLTRDAPLSALSGLYSVVRDPYFEELLRSGALRLINWRINPTVIFPSNGLAGHLAVHHVKNPDGNERSTSDLVRRLKPTPGKEKQAEMMYQLIEKTTLFIKDDGPVPLSDRVRGLTIRPHIRRLLGIADAVPASVVPRWNTVPILRLARLVQLADTCQREGIASLRVPYGVPELIGSAFASTLGQFWSDDAASFVLSGRFSTDLGGYVAANSEVIGNILNFETPNRPCAFAAKS